ncbi:hypothetical protein [Gehongia tenuis]|uniref:Uncharacterized protein n=1 Tax=Gehongia tenuis TaxID=2763655 RepID=A0A926D5Z4_9FIRM|nr:hypothetical protein [Gehongia tenuis]MBC8532003.1 hypothetical protein [Gehongia tenuis]
MMKQMGIMGQCFRACLRSYGRRFPAALVSMIFFGLMALWLLGEPPAEQDGLFWYRIPALSPWEAAAAALIASAYVFGVRPLLIWQQWKAGRPEAGNAFDLRSAAWWSAKAALLSLGAFLLANLAAAFLEIYIFPLFTPERSIERLYALYPALRWIVFGGVMVLWSILRCLWTPLPLDKGRLGLPFGAFYYGPLGLAAVFMGLVLDFLGLPLNAAAAVVLALLGFALPFKDCYLLGGWRTEGLGKLEGE